MKYSTVVILSAAALAASVSLGAMQAQAQSQTFRTYSCADGSQFAAAFYKYNPRFAHVQLDGKSVALKKRISVGGTRFSNNGITLRISKAGVTTLTHAKRPATVCSQN